MSTRYYPLYQRGNPQLRVFLPNFWMKLVRPKEPLPPNQVLFQTSLEMTRYDVQNYLEKIYKIPIVDIKVTIKMGSFKKFKSLKRVTKEDDYKEALVTMPRDVEFEFPNFTKSADLEEEKKRYRKGKDDIKNLAEKKHRHDIPNWFTI